MLEALCRQSSTTLDIMHAEDGPPITQRTSGLGAIVSSPIPRHQIDFNTPGSQRINQLWLVTYINEAGEEIVVQAKLTNGSYAPLIPAAHNLATTRNIKMRLIKLTDRVDIEDIVP
jgi:hypothetical protein